MDADEHGSKTEDLSVLLIIRFFVFVKNFIQAAFFINCLALA
jgi:hypothetical protein